MFADGLVHRAEAKAATTLVGGGEILAKSFIEPLRHTALNSVHAKVSDFVYDECFIRAGIQSAAGLRGEQVLGVEDDALLSPKIHAGGTKLAAFGDKA